MSDSATKHTFTKEHIRRVHQELTRIIEAFTQDDRRSLPGQGTPVQIYCGDPEAEGQLSFPIDVCFGTIGEDFAISHYPIVVKCDVTLSREQVINHLRWLANQIETGPATSWE